MCMPFIPFQLRDLGYFKKFMENGTKRWFIIWGQIHLKFMHVWGFSKFMKFAYDEKVMQEFQSFCSKMKSLNFISTNFLKPSPICILCCLLPFIRFFIASFITHLASIYIEPIMLGNLCTERKENPHNS